MTFSSYTPPTKSRGKHNVLLLSTVPPLLGVTKDDSVINPAICKLYDFTKGGTDVMDQRINFYSVHTKSPRWTVNAFAYILDTARVNSQTLYSLTCNKNPRKVVSLKYGWNLVRALCTLHIKRRQVRTNNLHRNQLLNIKLILSRQDEVREVEQEAEESNPDALQGNRKKRGRCQSCLESIHGAGYTHNHQKMKKSSIKCEVCHKYTCGDHQKKVCVE